MNRLLIVLSLLVSVNTFAVCMTYEAGLKYQCEQLEDEKSLDWCWSKYGARYQAYKTTDICSKELAAKLRGDINPKDLIKDIPSLIDEVDTQITMIDQEGKTFAGVFAVSKPHLFEFNTLTMKTLLDKMAYLKKVLYERSFIKNPNQSEIDNNLFLLDMSSKESVEFIKTSIRYLGYLNRIYKIYSTVAHNNQYVLKSYDYQRFNDLNLVLKKDFALEILAQAAFKTRHVEDGKAIEFIVAEQDKQAFEYMAMQDPNNKTEYAKLVSYIAIRETFTNLWAVQRLSSKTIENPTVNSCGNNFLSFRPGVNGDIGLANGMIELINYDKFVNQYFNHHEKIHQETTKYNLLDATLAKNLMTKLIHDIPEVKSMLYDYMFWEKADVDLFIEQSVPILLNAEKETWAAYLPQFRNIVLPADAESKNDQKSTSDILNKELIQKRISKVSYEVRYDGIKNALMALFGQFEDNVHKEVVNIATKTLELQRPVLEANEKLAIELSLLNFDNMSQIRKDNKSNKVKEVLDIFKQYSKVAFFYERLKNGGLKLSDYNSTGVSFRPKTPQEYRQVFNSNLSEFYDIQHTIEYTDNYKLVDAFFVEYEKNYNAGIEAWIKAGTLDKTEKDLEDLASSTLRSTLKYFQEKNPYSDYQYQVKLNYQKFAVQDNTAPEKIGLSPYIIVPVFNPGTSLNKNTTTKLNYENINYDNLKPDLLRYNEPIQDNLSPTKILGYNPSFQFKFQLTETANLSKFTSGHNEDKVNVYKNAINGNKVYLANNYYYQNEKLMDLYNSKVGAKYKINSKYNQTNPSLPNTTQQYKMIPRQTHSIYDAGELYFRMAGAFNMSKIYHHEMFAEPKLQELMQAAPLLRNKVEWTTSYEDCHWGKEVYHCTTKYKKHEESALNRLVQVAYTLEKGVNEKAAKDLITQVIDTSIKNTPGKLSQFCKADYLNYKTSPNFKTLYSAAEYIRATLKSPHGVSQTTYENINDFDEEIRKEIRTNWEAFNEDWLEPTLMIVGTIALVALAVVAIIGSGGAAAPGVVGATYSLLSTFLAIEFVVSFPLVVASLYARINTHFIEVPAQLKFQESLAFSQIDQAKVVDWDQLKAKEDENKSNKTWTVALAPLDFIYGRQLFKHFKLASGVTGVKAYKKLTGVQLRMFSAPPKQVMIKTSFADLRKKYGLYGAITKKVGNSIHNIRMYLPKYQLLDESLLNMTPLRTGLVNKATELGLDKKPWKLMDDLLSYKQKVTREVELVDNYVDSMGKQIERAKLKKSLTIGDLKTFGVSHSKTIFVVQSFFNALVRGPKATAVYFKNYGEIMKNFNNMTVNVVRKHEGLTQNMIDKLNDLRNAHVSGGIEGVAENDLFNNFLRMCTDEEVMMLENVIKKSKGPFKEMKGVFKDYRDVIQSLRPYSTLAGESFKNTFIYPEHIMQEGAEDITYKFTTEEEDIMNYYESLVNKHTTLGDDFKNVREAIELKIYNDFNYKIIDGQRVFTNP